MSENQLNISQLIEDAEKLFYSGNLVQSKDIFEELNRKNPGNSRVLNNLGVINFRLSRRDIAFCYFSMALRIDPLNEDANENLKLLKNQDIIPKVHKFPTSCFDANPKVRYQALLNEFNSQIKNNELKLAINTGKKLMKISEYSNSNLIELMSGLLSHFGDIPSIQDLWKRHGSFSLIQGDEDGFLESMYKSIYAESYFSTNPSYQFSKIDPDISNLIKLYAKSVKSSLKINHTPIENTSKTRLKIGFLLEGFGYEHAPIRFYLAILPQIDQTQVEVYVYSRYGPSDERAKKDNYAKTISEFSRNGIIVKYPNQPHTQSQQKDFLIKTITSDDLDILFFQTVYFVPLYHLLGHLKLARFQANLEHQQPEEASCMDMTFATPKFYLESPNIMSEAIIAYTKKNTDGGDLNISFPQNSIILVSVNRELKYQHQIFWDNICQLLAESESLHYIAVGCSKLSSEITLDPAVKERIIFPGFQNDIVKFLKISDIYIDTFPSGGGTSIIEAMYWGLPVVCPSQNIETLFKVNHESVSPWLVELDDLIVNEGDFPSWRRLILNLALDSELRKTLGAKVKELAWNKFSPKMACNIILVPLISEFSNKTGIKFNYQVN